MEFNKTKEYVITECEKRSACQPELDKIRVAETFDAIAKVLRANIGWVAEHELFNQVSILSHFPEDVLRANELLMGQDNIGFLNSGDRNSGDSNSGYRNSGDRNSGNWNSGNRNSGDRNSGNRNSGDSNSGDSNSGDSNSGNRNSGDRNSGNWNSGDRNSGDSNSGYRNSGAFCTEVNPTLVLFDKPTDILVKDWEQSEVCRMMYNIDPTVFVQSEIMTDKEKEQHPKHETTGGYLKTIPMHEAWANFWGNLPQEKRQLFLELPNFDAEKFKEITGIKV